MTSQLCYCLILLSILCSITDVSKANDFLEIDENEMDLTEDQHKALIGFFDSQNQEGELVYSDTWYRWDYGIIPYVFNSSQIFEEDFKNKIINAIEFLNKNLKGCVLMRYVIILVIV